MRECGINFQNLDLKKINKIYCFGTSFTAGGGYYFGSKDMENHYSNYYNSLNEYPKTMFNYSYPGQLTKLFNNVEIKNLGKCGYGDDRTSRLIFDIVENPNSYIDDTLFIIELSYLGREELYSNKFKSFMVHNYSIDDNLTYNDSSLAINHKYDDTLDIRFLNHLTKLVNEYNREFWNYENVHKTHNKNNIFLINYLLRNNLNFLIIEGTPNSIIKELLPNHYLVDFSPKMENHDRYSMNHFIEDNKLKISDVSNGEIEDYHASLEGNKLIASKIYQHLINHYNFE